MADEKREIEEAKDDALTDVEMEKVSGGAKPKTAGPGIDSVSGLDLGSGRLKQ